MPISYWLPFFVLISKNKDENSSFAMISALFNIVCLSL